MSINVVQVKELTETKKNIFIVSNVFQLLSAAEAQSFFKTDNNILLLLFFDSIKGNQKNIDKYIELFPFDQLITINILSINNPVKTVELLNYINKFEYDKVFTGFFSNNYKRILCNLKYEKLYLIDDGVYTYTIHNEIYNSLYRGNKNKSFNLIKNINNILDFFTHFYFNFYNYSNNLDTIKLDFFTVYPLVKYNNEEIVNHSFEKLKQIFSNKTISDKIVHTNSVIFLGQPLEKLGNVSHNEYVKYLEKISLLYKAKGLVLNYLPHPAENKRLLKIIKSKNISFLTINEPFEIYFLKSNDINNIASFISSALFNIKIIDKDVSIEAFQLSTDKINRLDVLEMYKFLNSQGIAVHKI